MVAAATATSASSVSVQPDAIRHPPTSASNVVAATMNAYQEEMCERLIQLSFVKIVSSKSERGGARLRKNLLILHLLQKARMEQRSRWFAAAAAAAAARNTNVVASQQPEMTSDSATLSVDTIRKEEETEDLQSSGPDEEMEKIDADASFSQQATPVEEYTPPPTPAPAVVLEQDDETPSVEEETQYAGAVLDAHSDNLPHCDNSTQQDIVSDQHAGDACQSDFANEEAEDVRDNAHSEVCSHESQEGANGHGDDALNRRVCLKRKHDSSDDPLSDRGSSPKVACVVRHRTPTPESGDVTAQQGNSAGSPADFNGLFSVLKTVTLESENAVADGNSTEPLSRSLSRSSFMELTCES